MCKILDEFDYIIILLEGLELSALEFGNLTILDFVYILPGIYLSSTNINQSAPNLVKINMTIRSQVGLVLELIGLEWLELSALENWYGLLCLLANIYKC